MGSDQVPNNTKSLCRNQGGTDTQFYSPPLVPLADERTVITSSLPCHSTVTLLDAEFENASGYVGREVLRFGLDEGVPL